jgi:hypothetical protein
MRVENRPARGEREARRALVVKRVVEILGWLTAVALFAFAGHAVLARQRRQAEVVVRPAQGVEERGAGGVKEKRPREAEGSEGRRK